MTKPASPAEDVHEELHHGGGDSVWIRWRALALQLAVSVVPGLYVFFPRVLAACLLLLLQIFRRVSPEHLNTY